MKHTLRYLLLTAFLPFAGALHAQVKMPPINYNAPFKVEREVVATEVKSQGQTGTCWCFSGTSLIESECNRGKALIDMNLSEMYTVRNIYLQKAQNYVLRQGKAQFSEGALGHDLIRAIADFGAMPESAYNGLVHKTEHDHTRFFETLKKYVDSVVYQAPKPLASDWKSGYVAILDEYLGRAPEKFQYNGQEYTPKSFAAQVLKYDPSEFICLTSFLHHPFYSSFILEVPDNFSNGSYYNLTLDELLQTAKNALSQGYSVMWDADVSNDGFRQQAGYALHNSPFTKGFDPEAEETKVEAGLRQIFFDNLATQDDHLMHIVGLEKSLGGKLFFNVKNSWGPIGPFNGHIKVSEAYFKMNTIAIIVSKKALDKRLLAKLGVNSAVKRDIHEENLPSSFFFYLPAATH